MTDQDLFRVALAAVLNDGGAWLAETIQADLASSYSWERRRGVVLTGLTAGNPIEQPDAWPEGPEGWAKPPEIRRAGRRRYYEACARFWWEQFLIAANQTEAFAAWSLFRSCVDRRAWKYLREPIPIRPGHKVLDRKKAIHLALNLQDLTREMKEHEEALGKTYLGEAPPTTLGAWGGF
jgi:hypothetical protein